MVLESIKKNNYFKKFQKRDNSVSEIGTRKVATSLNCSEIIKKIIPLSLFFLNVFLGHI